MQQTISATEGPRARRRRGAAMCGSCATKRRHRLRPQKEVVAEHCPCGVILGMTAGAISARRRTCAQPPGLCRRCRASIKRTPPRPTPASGAELHNIRVEAGRRAHRASMAALTPERRSSILRAALSKLTPEQRRDRMRKAQEARARRASKVAE